MAGLPAIHLGLPHEEYVPHGERHAPHYRCRINGHNVWVWADAYGGCYVALGGDKLMDAAANFHAKTMHGQAGRLSSCDHFTIKMVILSLTSGGNDGALE